MDCIREAAMLIQQTARPENLFVFTPELKSSMELSITKLMSYESNLSHAFISLLQIALSYNESDESNEPQEESKLSIYDLILIALEQIKQERAI